MRPMVGTGMIGMRIVIGIGSRGAMTVNEGMGQEIGIDGIVEIVQGTDMTTDPLETDHEVHLENGPLHLPLLRLPRLLPVLHRHLPHLPLPRMLPPRPRPRT